MGEEKQIVYLKGEVRDKLKKAITKLASAVKVTLGPGGRNVIIRNEREYYLTKDGVSVAKAVYSHDPVEQILLDLMKDVALETNKTAGDGTTTAIVLAEAIIQRGISFIEGGKSPGELKEILDRDLKYLLKSLDKLARPASSFEELEDIATVSANNNEKIGSLVARAIVGPKNDGAITIKESPSNKTYVEIVKGFILPYSGYLDTGFLNTKHTVELPKVRTLLVDSKVDSIAPFLHLLESIRNNSEKVIIVAHDFTQEVINILLTNYKEHTVAAVPVKIPGIRGEKTDNLSDLAAFTGSDLFTATEHHPRMGTVDNVIIEKFSTTIINKNANTTEAKDKLVLESKDEHIVKNDEKLKKRLANLSGYTSIIYVGGESDLEVKETIDRVEDAVNATQAAKAEGTVPGGGSVLNYLGRTAVSSIHPLLAYSLSEPMFNIILNTVQDLGEAGKILQDINIGTPGKRGDFIGYNAKVKELEDMSKGKIKDPVKVTKEALKNAVSIASMLLTTEGLVINEF